MTSEESAPVRKDPTFAGPAGCRSWLRQRPATSAIIIVNVLVFLVGWGVATIRPQATGSFERIFWNSPHLVQQKLWIWQILTANFVHSGVLHLAVNMFFVLWLGPRLERLLGTLRFALLYLGTGLVAYTVYDMFGYFATWGTTGGASGCVLGVATLYILCFPRHVVHLYGVIGVRLRWIILLFILSDISWFFWPEGGIPWINNVVHLGGAASGAAGWLLFGQPVREDEHD